MCGSDWELIKRGTCIRVGRKKWNRIHCSWGPITARHRAGVLVGSSMLLISSATHLVHIPNCWSCWPTAVQRVLLPWTWLRGHKLPQSGFSIDLSTNCPEKPTLQPDVLILSDFPESLDLSAPTSASEDCLVNVFPFQTSLSQSLPHLCEIQFLW